MKEYAFPLLIRRMTLSQVVVLNQKLAAVPSPLVSPNRLMVLLLLRAMNSPQIKHLVKLQLWFLLSLLLPPALAQLQILSVAGRRLGARQLKQLLSSLMSVRLRSVDFADNFLFNEAVEEESVLEVDALRIDLGHIQWHIGSRDKYVVTLPFRKTHQTGGVKPFILAKS
ncbi:hypothetical protein MP228_012300 [Amoeboaphelidium protococcarum]|nr:hypothetical protein MP228_012300 [Amoeboaphelidium protococcarum]